jgi:CheY-like chemotaxis protein
VQYKRGNLFALLCCKLVSIVVVDDEQDVGEMPQKKISTLVHTSVTGVNGLEALKKLRANNSECKEEFSDYERNSITSKVLVSQKGKTHISQGQT